MAFCKVYIATSIDGYIATKDHGLGWLEQLDNPDGADFGFTDHMASIDALVMGRGTFDAVSDFRPWPYDVPVIVASTSLQSVPDDLEAGVQILSGSPAELVEQCELQGLNRLYIDGGRLVTAFLDAGLIDEMTISRIPVLLGGGIPLFGEMTDAVWWDHVATEAFAGGLVQSTYRPTPTSSG